MSQMIDFTLPSCQPGRTLHAFRCVPEGEVRAVLQLSHGMVEFIDRYKPLAENLAARGILVTGNDHLGHGGSIRTKEDYGYFGEPDGNRAVLEDLHAVTTLTKQLYPGVPYFLLGHSMGSFYARQYLCEWGDELDGAIIMGTGYQPKALVQLARTICRVLAVFHGWHYRSKLVARLSFLGYNKGLEGRTAHDWLNRDPVEVDRYRADERCTFIFTLNAYYSMFSGMWRTPRRWSNSWQTILRWKRSTTPLCPITRITPCTRSISPTAAHPSSPSISRAAARKPSSSLTT